MRVSTSQPAGLNARPAVARPMAEVPAARSTFSATAAVTSIIFWTITVLYVIGFSLLSLRQYNAYLSHALDLGNMTQAFWNTVHGHPFKFQNMRAHINIEAFGTNTRLSFHVEPIIPFMAVIYFFWQHVQTLLVMQTVAVASGTIPIRLLARKHLGHPLAEIAFPAVYLLLPALEAANLYEFHPVTFTAPLLAWAFYLADTRRYTLFVIAAFAAMGCKEEIGVLVALIAVWIAVRKGDRRFGVVIALLGVTWTVVALKVIVPHFSGGDSSYWARYLPIGWPVKSYPVSQGTVMSFWLHHPGLVWDNLTGEAKRSYLHRLLFPAGYLSLLSPLTMLAGLPSLVLILLSYEPHMYSGLAHYSAELVPVTVIAAILGTEWLCRVAAPRLRIPSALAITVCCIYVLIASLLNQRVNGFTLLAQDFTYATITAHDRLLDSILATIPPNASVSAEDNLNAHLSDREQIYLFPDLDKNRVQYIVLDATLPTGSVMKPCDLAVLLTGDGTACYNAAGPGASQPKSKPGPINRYALLNSGAWTIVRAEDGIVLLKHRQPGQPLNNVLPPSFFSFAMPPAGTFPSGKPMASIGGYIELEGYQVSRAERPNLRNPDVVLTTWWRALKPLPTEARLMHYLTDSRGAVRVISGDQQTTDWIPLDKWKPGVTYKVTSYQLSVTTDESGTVDADVGLSLNGQQYLQLQYNLPVKLLAYPGTAKAVGQGKILEVTSLAAHL